MFGLLRGVAITSVIILFVLSIFLSSGVTWPFHEKLMLWSSLSNVMSPSSFLTTFIVFAFLLILKLHGCAVMLFAVLLSVLIFFFLCVCVAGCFAFCCAVMFFFFVLGVVFFACQGVGWLLCFLPCAGCCALFLPRCGREKDGITLG